MVTFHVIWKLSLDTLFKVDSGNTIGYKRTQVKAELKKVKVKSARQVGIPSAESISGVKLRTAAAQRSS